MRVNRLPEALQLARANTAVISRIVLVLGAVIVLIGASALFGHLFQLAVLKSYSFLPAATEMSKPTAIGAVFLGLTTMLAALRPPFKPNFRLALFHTLCLAATAGIGLYIMWLYFSQVGFNLIVPFLYELKQIRPNFLNGLSFVLLSLSWAFFLLGRHRRNVQVLLVCIPAMVVFANGIFAVVGFEYNIPPLYGFKVSFPGVVMLMCGSLAVMIAALPYRGLMLPLLSSEPRTRLFTLGSIISGSIVLCYGLSAIAAQSQYFRGADMPFEIREFYVISDFITILVSVLITSIGLRAAHYYSESLFYANEERQAAERENILRRIIQSVHSSLDLEEVFQTAANELGRYLDSDRCFISQFSDVDCKLLPPTREYRSSLSIESMMDKVHWRLETVLTELFGEACREGKHLPLMHLAADASDLSPVSSQVLDDMQALSAIVCPIFHKDRCLAVLFVQYLDKSHVWGVGEERLTLAVASQTGVAIHQSKLFLQEQAARKALEESRIMLEQSNRELEQFAAVASHDLQSPLRKIRMFTDQLEKKSPEALSPESMQIVERIHNGVCHMQELTEDVLDLARISTSKKPFQSVDLSVTLKMVQASLEPAIQTTQAHIEAGTLPTVMGDPTQLKQLLHNLLDNALKFQPKGQIPVIRIYSEPLEDGEACRLVIADNGIGFNMEQVDRIFQPFERLHGVSEYPGTGIGLAICRRIVERHHGTIQAQGRPGAGSVFTITLPVCIPSSAEAQPEQALPLRGRMESESHPLG